MKLPSGSRQSLASYRLSPARTRIATSTRDSRRLATVAPYPSSVTQPDLLDTIARFSIATTEFVLHRFLPVPTSRRSRNGSAFHHAAWTRPAWVGGSPAAAGYGQ